MGKTGLSVVMPTYNCVPLMDRHLDSMAKWADLADEIVVVDSRSTDATLELIKNRLNHPNVRFIERDRGLYESWNEGIAATCGEWIYISTAGDTIERDQLLHLRDLGERTDADVVISPPKFVDDAGNPVASLSWPPQEIISGRRHGQPFTLTAVEAASLAYYYCPNCILGSSASNLYRGRTLRARPFPCDFRGAGDTVWMMRNALSLNVCLTPKAGSVFCVHAKEATWGKAEDETFWTRLGEEKVLLARGIGAVLPDSDWAILAEEAELYAHSRRLKARRRNEWHSSRAFLWRACKWLGTTMAMGWQRVRLSYCRYTLRSQLTSITLASSHHVKKTS